MLDLVKGALRVTTDAPAIISEVENLIESAKLDLKIAGVSVDENDPLIQRAIITYCKANFGYDNPEAERFERSYVMLKQHLSLSGDYRET